MLVVDFDPSRKQETGQFHVRLIDAKSGDYGNDARRQSQLGYWCDLGHLESGVLRPLLAAIERAKAAEIPLPRDVVVAGLGPVYKGWHGRLLCAYCPGGQEDCGHMRLRRLVTLATDGGDPVTADTDGTEDRR